TADNADDEARDVIFAIGIETRHLGSFATEQHATIFATAVRDAFDDARDYFRRELSGRNVVEKEERPRALDEDVVDAVIHEIAADRVVNSGRERHFQFRADAICGGNEHRLAQRWKCPVKHSTEAANFGQRPRIEGRAGKLFDLFR